MEPQLKSQKRGNNNQAIAVKTDVCRMGAGFTSRS